MTFGKWWRSLREEVRLLLRDTAEGRAAPNDRRGGSPAKMYAQGRISLLEYWRLTREGLERKWSD